MSASADPGALDPAALRGGDEPHGNHDGTDPHAALRFTAVLLCFLLSGFAALLYQTVWTRQFAFVFGTSDLAVATVLAAYMGGLAAGAAAAARFADKIQRPILTYGLLELGIALSALAVPALVAGSTWLLVTVAGGLDSIPDHGSGLRAAFFVGCAFLILLIPTALMGATLPLLVRHAVRREAEIGSRIGLLYAANTFGAVLGVSAAGFVLIPALGLGRTVAVGVAANAVVFALAALLARGAPAPALTAAAGAAENRGGFPWVLPILLVSGAISFTYEVLWTRLLGHVFGGSVYAFATMLSSFLGGIALGSALAARLASNRRRAAFGLAYAEVGIALTALVSFAALPRLPEFALALGAGGLAGSLTANAWLGILVLLPQTICIGMTFPFAVRILARDPADAARASARVYSWNTVGAILGSVAAGFFVIPILGYAGTLTLTATLSLILAACAAALGTPPRRGALVAVATAAALLALLPPQTPWSILRSSPFAVASQGAEVVFHSIGRSASVLVLEQEGQWQLRTNGLPEAGIQAHGGRAARGKGAGWLPILATLARPDARSLLVVGLGGGVAVEHVPSAFDTVDVVELEPEVVAANRAVADVRMRDPLRDPRIRIIENDVRGALLLTDRRYDAVVSQPSHPWTSGASHLYTLEFFELVREHLTPGGVLVQWLGLPFMDDALLASLLATLGEAFEHVQLYRPTSGAAFFVASGAPFDPIGAVEAALAADPEAFLAQGVATPEDVAIASALDESGVRSVATGAAINTDDRNVLASQSPRVTGRGLVSLTGIPSPRLETLLAPHDPLVELVGRADDTLDPILLMQRLFDVGDATRARRILAALDDPASRRTGEALNEFYSQRPSAAVALFREQLQADSTSLHARAGLLLAGHWAQRLGSPVVDTSALALSDEERAFLDAWRAADADDWNRVAVLDADLAAIGPRHLLYRDALRLRARARIESGTPDGAAEALPLIDRIAAYGASGLDSSLRAIAAARAGFPLAAFADIAEALSGSQKSHPLVLERVRRAALLMPDEEPYVTLRRQLAGASPRRAAP